MTIELAIALVLAGLLVLVATAFIVHTIERNRQEKKRLQGSLKKKAADLHYMLDHFPDNFLGSDLKGLVCKSAIDVYEQLNRLEPRNPNHQRALSGMVLRLADTERQRSGQQYHPLESHVQIKEVKSLLGMLNNFIAKLANQKSISVTQANQFTAQMQRLFAQTYIDNYIIAAQEAEQASKYKLAVHNYGIAIDKIIKENMAGVYAANLDNFRQRIQELRQIGGLEASPTSVASDEDLDSEWNKFMADEEAWKKKSQYD